MTKSACPPISSLYGQDSEQSITKKRKREQKIKCSSSSSSSSDRESSDDKDGDEESALLKGQHQYYAIHYGGILPTTGNNRGMVLDPRSLYINTSLAMLANTTASIFPVLNMPLHLGFTAAAVIANAAAVNAAAVNAATAAVNAAAAAVNTRSVAASSTFPVLFDGTFSTFPGMYDVASSSTKQSTLSAPSPQNYKAENNKGTLKKPRTFKTFEQRIQDLLDFKKRFSHCNVPNRYDDDNSLGIWCMNVRSSYWKIQAGIQPTSYRLTEDQIKLLESIGFQWKLDRHGRCL